MTIVINFPKNSSEEAENDLKFLNKRIICAIETHTGLDFVVNDNEGLAFFISGNITFFTILEEYGKKHLHFTTAEGNLYEAYVNYTKMALVIEKK